MIRYQVQRFSPRCIDLPTAATMETVTLISRVGQYSQIHTCVWTRTQVISLFSSLVPFQDASELPTRPNDRYSEFWECTRMGDEISWLARKIYLTQDAVALQEVDEVRVW